MISPLKKVFLVTIAIVVVGGAFFFGLFLGREGVKPAISSEILTEVSQKLHIGTNTSAAATEDTSKVTDADMALFWKVWNILDEKFLVTTSEGKMPTDQEKIWGAISGLAAAYGDPYTTFFPPKEAEYFESEVRGNFEGVGMEVGIRDEILTVVAPLKNTPAEKAGIRAGDKIIEIDGTSTFNFTTDEAVDLIRGEKGTSVTFKIIREGEDEPLEITAVRDVIDIPTIETKKDEKNKVFIIELYNFSGQSANLFRNALREFIDSGYTKLIIDLRNNPGGYLEAAVDMASWFLPAGDVVVTEENKVEGNTDYRSKGYNIFNDNLKLAIIINGGSASASEIFAGALSEHGKATLVGEKSFGKGSVQELISTDNNTSLKVTVARWLTPEGHSISENGIEPDHEVKITKEDIENDIDPQLEKAIEILK